MAAEEGRLHAGAARLEILLNSRRSAWHSKFAAGSTLAFAFLKGPSRVSVDVTATRASSLNVLENLELAASPRAGDRRPRHPRA